MLAAGLIATCGGGDGSDSSGSADPGDTSGSGGSQGETTTVTCASLSPSDCGGDVAGSWALDSLCGASTIPVANYLPAECSGTFVSLEPADSTGEATFNDGAFTTTATLNFAASIALVSSCIQAIAAGDDVALVCQSLGPVFSEWDITATCALDGGDCKCAGTYSERVNEAGTYTVAGNQLTLTPASSAENPRPESATSTFCVRSGHLIAEVEPPVSGAQPFHSLFTKR